MAERLRVGQLPQGALFEIKLRTGLVHEHVIEDGLNMVRVTLWHNDRISQGGAELLHRGILVNRIRQPLVPGVDGPSPDRSYDGRRPYTLVPGVR